MDRLPPEAKLEPGKAAWGGREAAEVALWKPRFSAFHDTVTWAPMINPEQLKAVSLQAVREAGAEILFHVWASTAIVEDGCLRGVVFESKQGRFAVTARVVVDTTGDGDIFAGAGEASAANVEAASIHQCINTSWLWGGVDNERWLSFRRSAEYDEFSAQAQGARPVRVADCYMAQRRRRAHGAALGGIRRAGRAAPDRGRAALA